MLADDLAHSWPTIRAELQRAVPPTVYQVWLERIEPRELRGRTVVLAAPEPYRRHIAGRFARVLQTCAAAVLGPDVEVDVVGTASHADRQAARASASPPPRPGTPELNPKYTFEQFVIGEGNRLAHAAALAVAEQPGQAYNPLFLYGPPGVGKTHLLHSIAHYLRAYANGLSVRCTTADAFTNEFVSALHSGGADRFKATYRGADVLLVDDVQFLEAKARTEEEFFHTFNALHMAGAQLVLTSDRLPRDMAVLEERLRERFESGLVADISAPDLRTRVTILRKRAEHDRLEHVPPATLEVIAARVVDNVRALEGALIRVVAFHSLRGCSGPVAPELATHVLDRLVPARSDRPPRTVREIQERACEVFGLSLEELVSPSRVARVAWPRQLAMFLSRELTDASLPAIGRQFGGRDHATVLYAVRRAGERIASDPVSHDAAQRLTDALGGDRAD
jgi:chromosomal replication initiator protein